MFVCIIHPFLEQYKDRKDDNMNTVPVMVSTKDLAYLEDMMNWNFTLSKKAYHYSQEVTEPALKEAFDNLAVTLKQHFQTLLDCLYVGGTNES